VLFEVARFFLSPLVRWQARQVRLRAAQLPEAQGNREGVSGVGRVRLRVLIVGDSSAAGVGAHTQAQALSGRLGEALSQRLGGAVVWQVVARRGDTTRDSIHALERMSLRPADVMVTTVGLSDLLGQVPPGRWLEQLDRLDRAAARRAGVHHIVHCGLPPMRSYPLPNPLRWVLGNGQQRYNQALAAWVERWPERWWLPIPFENQLASDSVLMAEDGFHPGPAVYALWAEQLAGMISSKIVPRLPETTPTRKMPAQRLLRPRKPRA
jgi:lysophospholipase L1-like esterase